MRRSDRIGWLRAAVLGANDGLISTSSLVVGVAPADPSHAAILLAAVAGLAAGALSMAAGEYVSVSSQTDTEEADLARERGELVTMPEAERSELAGLYIARGLTRELAVQVAEQLMARDTLGAHARDELGIHEITRARPIQARGRVCGRLCSRDGAPGTPGGAVAHRGSDAGRRGSDLEAPLGTRGRRGSPGRRSIHAEALRGALWGAAAMGCMAAVGRLFGAVV